MVNGRNKGHTYERDVAQKFRDAGFPDCVTSRLESKRMDDLGVDLCYTAPWLVQCKAVEKLGPVHDLLARMPSGGMPVIFHKRNRKGTVVSMKEEDFFRIVALIRDQK